MEGVSIVVGKVVDLLFGVAIKEISYVCNRSENVENLKNEVEKLSHMKGRVQQRIDLAKRKGELILEGVEEWMSKADSKILEVTKFIAKEAEAKKTCFNLSTFRRYSKTAIKETSFIRQIQVDGNDFETCVSLPPRTPRFTDIYQRKNLDNIDSHKLALEEIIKAMEDDTIQIVGINGLGGVGKTTLASEIAVKMKDQFADIVFIAVSQSVDNKAIQEKVRVAASKIINRQKVLIILDDVWEELNLDELGIPCGSDKPNCKILLTSRNRDVCEAMNAQKNISINPLRKEEAWSLFERVVGKSEWDDRLKEVASKIVEECGGLPLFIQAVGKALKNKDVKSWEATLDRLQDPTDADAPFKRKGIMQLKLSYDYLESEVAKSCFLLCSMFPEDGTIEIQKLTYYGLGLGIFNDHDCNIQNAKHRVQLVVDTLKSSFLLFHSEVYSEEEEEEESFKMHDLVRDMAMLITSTGNEKFLVQSGRGLREWQLKPHLETYKKISLIGNRIKKLPYHELVFPHLDTFLIQDNKKLSIIHDEFFQGMEKVKVLDMSVNNITSIPPSLKRLTQLRTLDLSGNSFLCEISILGELRCLEILDLSDTGIISIPKEIGQLINLRLLNVYFCDDLSHVTSGVISKLVRLEELYIGLKEGNGNFLRELSGALKILHLKVPELDYIPEDLHFETLREFLITDDFYKYRRYESKRILHISKISFPLTMSVMNIIQACETLILFDVEESNNILLPDLYFEGWDKLRYIQLAGYVNVRGSVKRCETDAMQASNELAQRRVFSQVEKIELSDLIRLKLLWDRTHQYISFCNLTEILISNCPSLLELFPLSVAQGLVNLRDLCIEDCDSLVVVISYGDEQTDGTKTELAKQDTHIVFPVTHIVLLGLPKLECFYSGNSVITYPYLTSIMVSGCRSMKRWSYGENHIPNIKFEHETRLYNNINDCIVAQLEMNSNLILNYQ